MVSQSSKRAGDHQSAKASSSARPSGNSRPQGGISFVAFDAGISKEARRAVRVQAAKSSAAARKATIARKLAAQKQDGTETGRAKKSGEPSRPSNPATAEPVTECRNATRTHDSHINIDLLAPPAFFETQADATSPSTASSTSSRFLSDTDTDLTKPSCPHTPAVTHKFIEAIEAHHGEPVEFCECRSCTKITTTSSAATSPFSEIAFEPGPCEQNKTTQMIKHFSLPRPETISPGRHDPFSCYPVHWHSWYEGLLRYMMTVFAPRAWPVLDITSAQGQRWEWFMTQHAMAEPALFYVRLLFASGDLIRLGALNRECSFWLQSQAIKAINEALRDPQRSCSDGLILAVGRIALHECMYGDRAASNAIHRPAQRRMIDMRGGITKLGFPDLVKKLMRWADRVMSMQGNTGRFLPDDEDEGNTTYGLKQSVDVFEAWAPETGQALRKKITIADLLTD